MTMRPDAGVEMDKARLAGQVMMGQTLPDHQKSDKSGQMVIVTKNQIYVIVIMQIQVLQIRF